MLLLLMELGFPLEISISRWNWGVLLFLVIAVVDIEQVVDRPGGVVLARVFGLVGDSLGLGRVRLGSDGDPLPAA